VPRFFFIETSEGHVDPHVSDIPPAANAETFAVAPDMRNQSMRYQKRLEVRGISGEQKALLVLHSPHSLK
jgi:hypothetical protein